MLRETRMPAVLIELGFISNTKDNTLFDNHFDAYARAIANGIAQSFGISPEPEKPPVSIRHPIMGQSTISPEALAAFLLGTNADPRLLTSADVLAEYYIDEGAQEGVRGDQAFCQAIHETGWFRFGGDVLPEQNNFAGIGATNVTAPGKGAWFEMPQIGVRAQIQHLKAYATTEPLVNELVDPHFHLVTRGIAPHWED